MDAKHLVVLALQISIFCTVLGFGLKATLGDLSYLGRHPGLLGRSLLAVLVIMPLVAIALVLVFDLRHAVEVALVAVAISPVPPLLPKRLDKAGGHHAYALGMMATLALLAIVTVPLWSKILEQIFNRPVNVSLSAIAKVVLISALAPLVAGVTMRMWAPRAAERIANPISLIGTVLLPLAVLALLAGTWHSIWAAFGDGTLVALVAFVALGLFLGDALGGPRADHAEVLAISSACRHPALALSIASANFADERFGATILLYVLVNTLVGLVYLAWRRQSLATTLPG